MPECFVIMPYGGDDQEKRKYYNGIYDSIISAAAEKAGFSVKRSDLKGEPGNITHDIIRDLLEADIVIADLTTANPNVFFELGVRHVLRKSGTVHIYDQSQIIPFDLQQYRAIPYTADVSELRNTVDKIATAIKKHSENVNRSDNLVHDAIPSLPVDFRSIGDESLRRQLQQAEGQLTNLRAEYQAVKERLPFSVTDGDSNNFFEIRPDVDKLFDQADEIVTAHPPC